MRKSGRKAGKNPLRQHRSKKMLLDQLSKHFQCNSSITQPESLLKLNATIDGESHFLNEKSAQLNDQMIFKNMALSQYLGQLTLFVHRIGNLDGSMNPWANRNPSNSIDGLCAPDSSIDYMSSGRSDYWTDDILVNGLEMKYADRQQQKQTENTSSARKGNTEDNAPNPLDNCTDNSMSNTLLDSMTKKLTCDFDENFRIDSSDLIKLLPSEQAAFYEVLLDVSSNSDDARYCSM